jgi:allantoicase
VTQRHTGTGPDFRRLPDLASRALGAAVIHASDEFYGEAHNLITAAPAAHDPLAFGIRGKVYDGWETRRHRTPGEDFAIVRLAVPGVIHGVTIDTAHFRGNYPPMVSVQGATLLGYPPLSDVLAAEWSTLLNKAELEGNCPNVFEVDAPPQLVTHLTVTMHPDGGIARLRAYGEVVPDPRRLGGRVDLAALVHGGYVHSCSNMFYGSPANVLSPGVAQTMADGWETARRRDDGNDWLIVALAAPGVLRDVVIDTSRFVGNAPGWARLSDAATGAELLPRTALLPDTEHRFRLPPGAEPTGLARLDIYPDGGISRLRLLGDVPHALHEGIAERWWDLLPPAVAAGVDRATVFD